MSEMSENVKINIFEIDNTSPAGSGIDSTDIAFVPGFSILPDAPANAPTLVTSTKEFETLFGKQPRVLTHRDVSDYTSYGFMAGDYDRSYVYAKELLYQGMPVVYSNIVGNKSYDVMEVSNVSANSTNIEANLDEEGTIQCNILKSVVDPVSFEITIPLRIELSENNIPKVTTYELIPEATNCEVSNLTIDLDSVKLTNTKIKFVSYDDNILEFINPSDTAEELTVKVKFNVKFDSTVVSDFTIKLNNRTDSLLDAFYKTTEDGLVIDKQWEIGGDNTISDKSIYSVKYITSGGYPSVVSNDNAASQKFSANMLAAAAHRGDAVALIDYQMLPEERVFSTDKDSITFYSKMHASFDDVANAEYGAAMYPWSIYNCANSLNFADSAMISMPASFGYLMCVAKAIKSSPNWLAMAGVTRGLVPGINKLLVPGNVISNAIAEEMQPKFGVENHRLSINTITNIRPYGLTLWGNRTLKPVSKDGTVALNFLNTRNMLSDIKKLLYTTAKSCMFEQNSSDLWIKFKDGIEPLLRRMKAGNGISDYQIVRGTTKYNGDPLTKGEIAAVIKVYPMYAVEYFELAVEINDEEVSVS